MSVTQPVRKAAKEPAVAVSARGAALLEEAFARHQGELLGTLYYLVGNLEDARDALQEAFIKCWRHQAEVGQVENLKAWIFRVALNAGRDIRETAWRRKRQALPEDEADAVGVGAAAGGAGGGVRGRVSGHCHWSFMTGARPPKKQECK